MPTREVTRSPVRSPVRSPFFSASAVSSFDPLVEFFNASETGFWYDFTDLSTLFQEAAGSTPVTSNGNPIGRANDKSPNGHVIVSDDSTARPLYQTSGYNHALFDGSNDYLEKTSGALPLTTFYAVFGVEGVATKASNNRVFSAYPATGNDFNRTDAFALGGNDGTNLWYASASTPTPLAAFKTGAGVEKAVVELVKTSTTCEIIVNGTSVLTDSSFTALTANSAGGFGFTTAKPGVTVRGCFNCRMVEALWSSKSVSAGGHAQMRTRVGNKLGLSL